MSIAVAPPAVSADLRMLADSLRQLGDVPAERVLLAPPPGTASEEDLLQYRERYGQLCELVDGVLVKKTTGWEESAMVIELAYQLKRYLKRDPLGIVLGTDGPVRTLFPQVHMPHISFIHKRRISGKRTRSAVLPVAPDLAMEVLAPSKSPAEMERKLEEYFAAGVKLVWCIDPHARRAWIDRSPTDVREIGEEGYLAGEKISPGFRLRLKQLLDDAPAG